MQLPEFTNEQIDRWTKLFDKPDTSIEIGMREKLIEASPLARKMLGHVNVDQMREMFFCGEWIKEYLNKLPYNPYTDKEIGHLCRAFGQRSLHTKKEDMKTLAVVCLENFLTGYREPDPQILAPIIFKEHAEKLGFKI